MGLCDALADFTQACERKLRLNRHKGGWQNTTMAYLLRRLAQEKGELVRAVRANRPRAEVLEEAADVANFAMMIADVYAPKDT